MASNNLLDEMIQATEPVSTNVALNMPSILNEIISQNYSQGEIRDLDYLEENNPIIHLVEGITTGNIPLPIAKVLWRGITDWIPKSMVKGGKFVGGGKYSQISDHSKNLDKLAPKETIQTTTSRNIAEGYARRGNWTHYIPEGKVLEFDIPDNYLKDLLRKQKAHMKHGFEDDMVFIFEEGIPKKYFKKLHHLAGK
tara:strand:+ start:1665 stop:2252 length:588 start_codon:yes stop_codon:yes gene_type:complete